MKRQATAPTQKPIVPLSRKAKRLINALAKAASEYDYEMAEGWNHLKQQRLKDALDKARRELENYILQLEMRDMLVSAALV